MKTDNFEKILKQRFEGNSIPPPPSLILRVERHLSMANTPIHKTPSKRLTSIVRYLIVAASIFMGIFILNTDPSDKELYTAGSQNEKNLGIVNSSNSSQPSELISHDDIEHPVNLDNSLDIKASSVIEIDQSSTQFLTKLNTAENNESKPTKGSQNRDSVEVSRETKANIRVNPDLIGSTQHSNTSFFTSYKNNKKPRRSASMHIAYNNLASGSSIATNKKTHTPYELSESSSSAVGGRIDITSPGDLNHKVPINVGVYVGLSLSERLSIESGLVYSKLKSSSNSKNNLTYRFEQNLDYLGIPIALRYKILSRNVGNLYARGGIMVERIVSASRQINISGENHYDKFSVQGVQPSINLSLGGEMKLFSNFGLFLEPGINYYFNSGQPENYRTQKQVNFSLSAGLRFLI